MSYKERIQRAIPIWRQMLERPTPFVRQVAIAGGSAGIHTVTAIKKGDQLVVKWVDGLNLKAEKLI